MAENKKKSSFGSLVRSLFGSRKQLSVMEEELVQSPTRTALKNFMKKKLSIIGMTVFMLIFLACFIFPIFFPLDLTSQDTTQQNLPPQLNYLSVPSALSKNAALMSSGSSYGVGMDKNGKIYVWGHTTDKLKSIPANMGKVVAISAGFDHVLALNDQGQVFTWGSDRFNLTKMPDMSGDKIVQIAAGMQISTALSETGHLYVWGNEGFVNITPKNYQGNIKSYSLNASTALAILSDNNVVCMTSKDLPFGRLPEEVAAGGNVVDIASTDRNAAALMSDGRVIVWGTNVPEAFDIPEKIQGHVVDVDAGRSHFTVLLDDGSVASWGLNDHDQSAYPNLKNVNSISAGYFGNYTIDSSGKVNAWGLKGYLLGTDQFGRDMFRRLVKGGQVTLTVGFVAVVISGFLGVIIGGISGYYGGKVDIVLMRFGEIINSIPFLPLAMILSVIVGSQIPDNGRIFMIMVILGVLSWPSLARLTRGAFLAQRESEYVTAAKAMGIKEAGIIFKHILPNILAIVLVNITIALAGSMLTESSLSFLGFGVAEPNPTWGNMLMSCNDSTVIAKFWWRWVFPSVSLGLATVSINLIGDGLRDAIDPKSNDR